MLFNDLVHYKARTIYHFHQFSHCQETLRWAPYFCQEHYLKHPHSVPHLSKAARNTAEIQKIQKKCQQAEKSIPLIKHFSYPSPSTIWNPHLFILKDDKLEIPENNISLLASILLLTNNVTYRSYWRVKS